MEQTNVKILERKGKDANGVEKTYYSMRLKTGMDKKTVTIVQGIDPGNYIDVVKKYKDGKPNPFDGFNVVVTYKDKDVQIALNKDEYAAFSSLGDAGAKLRITMNTKPYAGWTRPDGTKIPPGVKFIPTFELI